MRIFLSIYLLVIFTKLHSQSNHSSSLLAKSTHEFNNLNYDKSIQYADKTKKLAKEKGEKEILLNAEILLAKNYYEKGFFYKSLKIIDGIDTSETINVKSLIEIKKVKGKIFREINLFDFSKKEFNEQLQLSDKLNNYDRYINKIQAHESLMKLYLKIGHSDSMKLNLDHQLELLHYLDEEKYPHIFYNTFLNYTQYFITKKDYINALTYLKKSKKIIDNYKLKNVYQYNISKAKIHLLIGDLDLYEEELLKALSNCKLHGKKKDELDIYKKLVLLTSSKNNNSNYISSFKNLKDSITQVNIELNNLAYNNLIKNKINKNDNRIIFLLSIFILIFIIFLIIFLYYYIYYKKVDFTKQNQAVKPVDELKFRLLLELVTSNDPKFLILFKELYPEFIERIKQINPYVRSSELTFLAMCYLNLSTKDIAEYTFVTVRAVQIRKNRLRKKFNIASNVDFNSAIRNINISEIKKY